MVNKLPESIKRVATLQNLLILKWSHPISNILLRIVLNVNSGLLIKKIVTTKVSIFSQCFIILNGTAFGAPIVYKSRNRASYAPRRYSTASNTNAIQVFLHR